MAHTQTQQFHIDYIPTRRGPIVLLDEDSRARLEATAQDLKQKAELLEESGYKADAAQHRMAMIDPQRQLDADRMLRETHKEEIKTAVVEFNEPMQSDVDDLRELALKEKDDPAVGVKIRRAAFEKLAPRVIENHPGGEGREDVPVKFRPLVESFCYSAAFSDLSEELILFLTASRRPSSSENP